jgi:hypothetical protein
MRRRKSQAIPLLAKGRNLALGIRAHSAKLVPAFRSGLRMHPYQSVQTALTKTGHFRFIQYQTATLLNTRSVSQQTSLSTTTHYWRSSVPYSPPHLVSNHRQRYLVVEFAYQSQPGGIRSWTGSISSQLEKLRSEIGRPTPIR